jgi:hypothetical protein
VAAATKDYPPHLKSSVRVSRRGGGEGCGAGPVWVWVWVWGRVGGVCSVVLC